jgi:hypothetical protein
LKCLLHFPCCGIFSRESQLTYFYTRVKSMWRNQKRLDCFFTPDSQ